MDPETIVVERKIKQWQGDRWQRESVSNPYSADTWKGKPVREFLFDTEYATNKTFSSSGILRSKYRFNVTYADDTTDEFRLPPSNSDEENKITYKKLMDARGALSTDKFFKAESAARLNVVDALAGHMLKLQKQDIAARHMRRMMRRAAKQAALSKKHYEDAKSRAKADEQAMADRRARDNERRRKNDQRLKALEKRYKALVNNGQGQQLVALRF